MRMIPSLLYFPGPRSVVQWLSVFLTDPVSLPSMQPEELKRLAQVRAWETFPELAPYPALIVRWWSVFLTERVSPPSMQMEELARLAQVGLWESLPALAVASGRPQVFEKALPVVF